jgi:ABC-2 type transport system permease protein
LPAGAAVLSRVVAPTTSQFALINEAREASLEANRRLLENLQSYVSDHPELATGEASNDDWAAKLYVSQLVVEGGLSQVLAAQGAAQERQMRWGEVLRFVSPASALDHAMAEAAGTGRARQDAYVEQVTQFLHDWRASLSPLVFRRQRLVADDIEDLPRFHFAEPAMPASVFASSIFVLALALLALATGYRRFTRIGALQFRPTGGGPQEIRTA